MLERFTRERQRASKGDAFNLDDEDELTHYGQSLSKLDDFDNVGLGLDDEEEDEGTVIYTPLYSRLNGLSLLGQIDRRTVEKSHFGGFGDDEDESDDGEGQVVYSFSAIQYHIEQLFNSPSGRDRRPKLWLRSSQRAKNTKCVLPLPFCHTC